MKPLLGRLFLAAAVLAQLAATPATTAESSAGDGCAAFTWNVTRELETLAKPPKEIQAARDGGGQAVRIEVDSHYLVRLAPQAEVRFAVVPGKPPVDSSAHAGLLTFRVPHAGRYRISLTSNHWIDVVDGASLVASLAFQGQRGCARLHKIVEFDLPADRELILQLSVGTATQVGISITAVD